MTLRIYIIPVLAVGHFAIEKFSSFHLQLFILCYLQSRGLLGMGDGGGGEAFPLTPWGIFVSICSGWHCHKD